MGGDWESAWPLQQKHIAGDCIDLATERQNVKDYIIGAITRYLDMGVDALRIDTVKHIERGNLLEYVNAWKAHKPGLFVFGENLVKGYGWGDMGGRRQRPVADPAVVVHTAGRLSPRNQIQSSSGGVQKAVSGIAGLEKC